jgi:hypothetical protein
VSYIGGREPWFQENDADVLADGTLGYDQWSGDGGAAGDLRPPMPD